MVEPPPSSSSFSTKGQVPIGDKKFLLLGGPVALIISMYFVFQTLVSSIGFNPGYLIAFSVYWIGWGFTFPVYVLGGLKPVVRLFSSTQQQPHFLGRSRIILGIITWLPILFPLLFVFLTRISIATPQVILVSVIIGFVIGITEEILWRTSLFASFQIAGFLGGYILLSCLHCGI